MTIKEAFEKVFPKVYEKPGLYPLKEVIFKITLETLGELNASSNDE